MDDSVLSAASAVYAEYAIAWLKRSINKSIRRNKSTVILRKIVPVMQNGASLGLFLSPISPVMVGVAGVARIKSLDLLKTHSYTCSCGITYKLFGGYGFFTNCYLKDQLVTFKQISFVSLFKFSLNLANPLYMYRKEGYYIPRLNHM